MVDKRWTWDARANPKIERVLAIPASDLGWCGQLETATTCATVGKVLCVCAVAAVAREIARRCGAGQPVADALDLLLCWIEAPTEERFECICSLIFDRGGAELDQYGVVWWALRTATSSVGNFEAGWALEATCSAALDAGLTAEQMRMIVERELVSRSQPAGPGAARQD